MLIPTHQLAAQNSPLTPHQTEQVYCGLDNCVTIEAFEAISALRPHPQIYSFERALQAPYLEIMQRGFLIDEVARRHAAESLRIRIQALTETLNQLAEAVWNRPLNPRSPLQLREFFYKAMALPEVWLSQKGERKLSTNREALEKLDQYLYARPFVNCILLIRDLAKQLEVFTTEIDFDGRMRTSYNIAGTETGRPSSSSNAFGTGGNLQNITPALRYVFVSDPGWKLVVIDLEQVEARDEGFFIGCLFDDWLFLNACESGDLHTTNCRLIWPEMPWTGELKQDRRLADQVFYRDFTFRDMSKRGGHLTGYMGTAWTMSRALKIPIALADAFQARYCKGTANGSIAPAYPGIPRFWQWIAQELQTKRKLTTPFGRERHFFGRPGDDTTLREAIAFLPQSTTADRMNLGLWRVWKRMPQVQLLAQTYDSITFQVQDGPKAGEAIQQALELIRVELRAPNGRSYVVPGEAKWGWNWGYESTKAEQERARAAGKKVPRLNIEGLRKWTPGAVDERRRATGLDRRGMD